MQQQRRPEQLPPTEAPEYSKPADAAANPSILASSGPGGSGSPALDSQGGSLGGQEGISHANDKPDSGGPRSPLPASKHYFLGPEGGTGSSGTSALPASLPEATKQQPMISPTKADAQKPSRLPPDPRRSQSKIMKDGPTTTKQPPAAPSQSSGDAAKTSSESPKLMKPMAVLKRALWNAVYFLFSLSRLTNHWYTIMTALSLLLLLGKGYWVHQRHNEVEALVRKVSDDAHEQRLTDVNGMNAPAGSLEMGLQ